MANRSEEMSRHYQSATSTPPVSPEGDYGDTGPGLWSLVNERLGGRWRYALFLGTCLGAAASVLAYHSTKVKYESAGIVHVSPKTNVVMREIPETRMVPRYPSFIQTQATLISTSPRILERALQSVDLENLPWQDRVAGMRVIRSGLNARVTRDSELIHVTFTHESPIVAQAVVNAVIRAYAEFHVSADGDDVNQTLRTLRSLRESLRNQRMQRQSQVQELISNSDYAYSEMGEIIAQKAMRLQAMEAEIRQLEHVLAMNEAHQASRRTIETTPVEGDREMPHDPVTGAKIDPRDLEAFDQELARLGRAWEQARIAMERARERFFPRHRAYTAAEEELRIAERMYRERQMIVVKDFIESDHLSLGNWAMEPKQRLAQLQREAQQVRLLLTNMQQAQMRLNDLRSEIEELQHEERETAARIRSLSTEADSLRRISIASLGELPVAPAQDRRSAFAAIGAIGGLASGIGFFFILASLDRRVYGVAQLGGAAASRQLLGVLPALPRNKADLETSGVAAHCVHQIRNRVESLRKPGRSAVIAVSSPYQGDGKTSLTLALAASYAASGYRLLLVDCDMIGRSLSHNLMMTGRPGLQECLLGEEVEELIRPLQVENIHVLPVGDEPSMGPERLRKSEMEVLFQRLRQLYDVVLVDTGPLIGSVETIPVVSAADGVVLTMWRGRRQSRLEECIRTMQNAGVHYLGVVLNYAMQSDCNRYLSCSKTSAVPHAPIDGSSNGNTRNDASVSRNALLRAMQVTARPRPRRHVGTNATE